MEKLILLPDERKELSHFAKGHTVMGRICGQFAGTTKASIISYLNNFIALFLFYSLLVALSMKLRIVYLGLCLKRSENF